MDVLSGSMRRNVFIIIASLFVGLFFAAAPKELCWPFIIALGGMLLGIFLILPTQAEDRKILFAIFIGGFLLRLVLALLLYGISSWIDPIHEGFLIVDGYSYNNTGTWVARQWQMGIFPDAIAISKHSATGAKASPSDYWTGFIYFFVGRNPIALFFINSLAGSLVIIPIYFIAKQVFNKRGAVVAALLCAFWPSLVLWSTQNLKEPITILLLTISLWALMKLRDRFKSRYILFLILSIFVLSWWQERVAVVLGLSIFLSLLFSANTKWIIKTIIVTGLVILLILPTGIPFIIFLRAKEWLVYCSTKLNLDPQTINHLRHARALEAGSAFLTNMDISSLPRTFVFLPFALLFLLLAPFPWQLGSFIQILAVPEMLLWYILLPFTFRGISFSITKKWRQSSAIILFIILMAGALALFEGNVGTMFRHRSIISIFLFIFTSVGIVQARERKAKNLPS